MNDIGRVKVRGGVNGTNKYRNRPRIFVIFVISIDGINGEKNSKIKL